MNIDALSMMTLQELQDGFANRWITPLEVMQLTFQQIEAGDWNAARTLEIACGIERGVAFCRALMEGVDFLLTPVMPLVNFAAERRGSYPAIPLRHTTFAAPFNQSGHPAVTI
ncbi:hypothetical protein [Roseovarius sp. ZX-A-9]|uniref:hypothetical protein n=1 Tax=Roseovarius sp. ZX-A-9 TaxID=3014783 RepID=UPI00232D3AA1|nr:hypothetical protein [Roseovarius sp. ZX-A-9]